MKISVAVMGHPKRINHINALEQQLAFMPFTSIDSVLDEVNEEWHTGKRALQAGIGRGDWHCVIQDDANLTPDFYDNLVRLLNNVPAKTLVSLYTGTARPLADRVRAAVGKAKDGEWLMFHQLLWGVGIAIPTDHIEPVLEFVQDVELQYDNRIGEFYCRNALPVYYCIPSLVDHNDDLGSLIEGHGIGAEHRVAHRVASGRVNWSSKSHYI